MSVGHFAQLPTNHSKQQKIGKSGTIIPYNLEKWSSLTDLLTYLLHRTLRVLNFLADKQNTFGNSLQIM